MRATMIAGAMALMACASTPKQVKAPAPPESAEAKAAAEQDAKDQARLVCTWERATGTNFPEKVCRLPEQADEDATQGTVQTRPSGQSGR
jgi:hypothetical protein